MSARVPTPNYSKPSGHGYKHLPSPYKLRRYYTPEEVGLHCTGNDCWVSFFNAVYDLTKLLADNREQFGELCTPIEKVAGTDITHWFDPITQEVSFVSDFDSEFSPREQLTLKPTYSGGTALWDGTCTSLQSSPTRSGTLTALPSPGGRTSRSESAL